MRITSGSSKTSPSASVAALLALAFAFAAPAAQAFPGADEAVEICFKNKNRGASISFYLFPADPNTGKRVSKRKVWEAGHQSAVNGRRCMTMADHNPRVATQRGAMVAYYTIEGKAVGEAHLACGPVFLKLTRPVQRVVYTFYGSTIFNVRCERTFETNGRFLHPGGNGAIAVDEICFDVATDSDSATSFRLYDTIWPEKPAWNHQKIHHKGWKPVCVKTSNVKGFTPHTELDAKITTRGFSQGTTKFYDCSMVRSTHWDRYRDVKGVKTVALFRLAGRGGGMRCDRVNFIER